MVRLQIRQMLSQGILWLGQEIQAGRYLIATANQRPIEEPEFRPPDDILSAND